MEISTCREEKPRYSHGKSLAPKAKAMPDDALSFSNQAVLRTTVRDFLNHRASESEARRALAPAIGLPPYDAGLSAYLDVLLRRVASGEVSPDLAVADMAEIAHLARRYDPDLRNLLVLGAE